MAIFHKLLPLLALLVAAGCGRGARPVPAPLDRFTYPTGLAVVPLAGGGRALAVVSSNSDLRFASADGGSVLLVDPDASSGDALAVLGAARIASFGGEIALLSAATCPGWTGPEQLLVPSRTANELYRIDVDAAGGLACGEACPIPLEPTLADPYAVQVVCRGAPGALDAAAWVTHIRGPGARGWLSRLDLDATVPPEGPLGVVELSTAGAPAPPAAALAWDAGRDRLYLTGRVGSEDVALAPLGWLDLAAGTAERRDLAAVLRGGELRSIALSSDRTRAYVAVRLFDTDLFDRLGIRADDLGGALAVVDLSEDAAGQPSGALLRVVPVGVGPSEVEVLPRGDGRRDVVAIASSGEGTVTLYDDAAGAVAAVLGALPVAEPDAPGGPRALPFGEQPFGLVSEAVDAATRRLYVGSYDRGFVRVVDVDLDDPSHPRLGKRFGREMPR